MRFPLLALLTLAASCSHPDVEAGGSPPPARLAFLGADLHDAGEVLTGSSLATRSILVNDTDAQQSILAIDGDCGCGITHLLTHPAGEPYAYGDPIEPGDGVRCDFTVDTSGQRGAFAARFRLTTTEPDPVDFVVRARVLPLMVAEPEQLHLGTILAGSAPVEFESVVRSPVFEKFVLALDPDFARPDLHARLAPVGEPDARGAAAEWRLALTVDPSIEVSTYSEAVPMIVSVSPAELARAGFETKSDRPVMTTRVFVQGRITGPVYLDERALSFGRLLPGASSVSAATMRVHPGAEPALAACEVVLHPEIGSVLTESAEVTLDPIGDDERARRVSVRVDVDPDASEGPFRGTLELRFPGTGLQSLTCAVFGLVSRVESGVSDGSPAR